MRTAVVRYDAAGNLDPAFGSGGVVINPSPANSQFASVAVDDRDRVLAAGAFGDPTNDFYVARFIGDQTAPTVTLGAEPAEGAYINDPTPTISFSVSDSVSHGCGFDGVVGDCASPFTPGAPLPDGTHTFSIAATDRAGNVGSATRTVNIDTIAPVVDISGKKKIKTRKKKTHAKLTVTVSEPATLTCHVDNKPPTPCEDKFKTPKLKDGKHHVFVDAVDQAGNTASDAQKVKVVAN